MQNAAPKTLGPLSRREARFAWTLLLPTILSVALVIVLPLMAIFWISFKPIALEDLRPASAWCENNSEGSQSNQATLP